MSTIRRLIAATLLLFGFLFLIVFGSLRGVQGAQPVWGTIPSSAPVLRSPNFECNDPERLAPRPGGGHLRHRAGPGLLGGRAASVHGGARALLRLPRGAGGVAPGLPSSAALRARGRCRRPDRCGGHISVGGPYAADRHADAAAGDHRRAGRAGAGRAERGEVLSGPGGALRPIRGRIEFSYSGNPLVHSF